MILEIKYNYKSHFVDKETEAQKSFAQSKHDNKAEKSG